MKRFYADVSGIVGATVAPPLRGGRGLKHVYANVGGQPKTVAPPLRGGRGLKLASMVRILPPRRGSAPLARGARIETETWPA